MAFQEHTTVNSHRHVIDLVESFLTAQGWTIDSSIDSTQRELYVSRVHGGETFYYSIKSTGANSVVIRANTAYPEAGSCDAVYLNLRSTSMVRAWLFAGDLYCHIIVEVAAGYMQMSGFGRLTPYSGFAYTTTNREGAFVYGGNDTAWSTLGYTSGQQRLSLLNSFYYGHRNHVRYVPVAGVAWGEAESPLLMAGDQSYPVRESWLLNALPGSNGDRPMLPIRILMKNNPAVTAGYCNEFPFGTIPAMRVMSMFQVINASEQTLGADVWKRFPCINQNVAVSAANPANTEFGFAFLK